MRELPSEFRRTDGEGANIPDWRSAHPHTEPGRLAMFQNGNDDGASERRFARLLYLTPWLNAIPQCFVFNLAVKYDFSPPVFSLMVKCDFL